MTAPRSSSSRSKTKKEKKEENALIRSFHEEISWACDLLLPFGWQEDSDVIDLVRKHLELEPLTYYATEEEQVGAVAFYRGLIFMDKLRTEQLKKQQAKDEKKAKRLQFLNHQAEQEKASVAAKVNVKKATAASNWNTAVDPSSGNTYYYHVETRQVQWHKPKELELQELQAKENDNEAKSKKKLAKPAPVQRDVSTKLTMSCRELSIERYQRSRILKQIELRRVPTTTLTDEDSDTEEESDQEEETPEAEEDNPDSADELQELLEDLKETELNKLLLLNQIKGPDVSYVPAVNDGTQKEQPVLERDTVNEAASSAPASQPRSAPTSEVTSRSIPSPPPPSTSPSAADTPPPPPPKATSASTADNEPDTVERLQAKLELAEKKQKRLEEQLTKAGIVLAEDIPYQEAKEKVEQISKRINEIGNPAVTHEDPETQRQLRKEYHNLAKDLEKYVNSLLLTDEYKEEQRQKQQEWERAVADDNQKALESVQRHMPVQIRHMSRQQQKDAGMPAALVRKFERTNVLRLIRRAPDVIALWHPSLLSAAWVAGLTLTERRAIHCHLTKVSGEWKAGNGKSLDKTTQKKVDWVAALTKQFKEALHQYQQHVELTDGKTCREHKCSLIGRQCPVRADLAMDYSGDLGFPVGEVYEEEAQIVQKYRD